MLMSRIKELVISIRCYDVDFSQQLHDLGIIYAIRNYIVDCEAPELGINWIILAVVKRELRYL
jgi:hypothetical protein